MDAFCHMLECDYGPKVFRFRDHETSHLTFLFWPAEGYMIDMFCLKFL